MLEYVSQSSYCIKAKIEVNFRLEKFAFCEKKGSSGLNICEKGVFSKLENADMSSFTVLSEGAGFRRLIWTGFPHISLGGVVGKSLYSNAM